MQPLKVLVAFDGSACAQVAIDLVKTVPWAPSSQIHVVSVVDSALPPYGTGDSGAADPIERQGTLIGGLANNLERLAQTLATSDRTVETHILVGRPATAIVDEARVLAADLIVVGSRGHGTIASMVLGSVSAEVADHASCPVLVARRTTWSRAVLGVDGSQNAQKAIDVVRDWSVFAGLTINVVSVADTGLPVATSLALGGYPGAVDYPGTEKANVVEHGRWAERAARELTAAGRPATPQAPEGSPAAELIRIAREDDADVLVVGTRGQTGVKRLLVGSVARNVLLHAGSSVLVIKDAPALT